MFLVLRGTPVFDKHTPGQASVTSSFLLSSHGSVRRTFPVLRPRKGLLPSCSKFARLAPWLIDKYRVLPHAPRKPQSTSCVSARRTNSGPCGVLHLAKEEMPPRDLGGAGIRRRSLDGEAQRWPLCRLGRTASVCHGSARVRRHVPKTSAARKRVAASAVTNSLRYTTSCLRSKSSMRCKEIRSPQTWEEQRLLLPLCRS